MLQVILGHNIWYHLGLLWGPNQHISLGHFHLNKIFPVVVPDNCLKDAHKTKSNAFEQKIGYKWNRACGLPWVFDIDTKNTPIYYFLRESGMEHIIQQFLNK